MRLVLGWKQNWDSSDRGFSLGYLTSGFFGYRGRVSQQTRRNGSTGSSQLGRWACPESNLWAALSFCSFGKQIQHGNDNAPRQDTWSMVPE